MIRANISDARNRFSYYIGLVRGGEEIEVMDRDTPVARIVHVSKSSDAAEEASWIKEGARLGLMRLPLEPCFPPEFFDPKNLISPKASVLNVLLEERDSGR